MKRLQITLDVRGSFPTKFEEGWSTVNMKESGINIAQNEGDGFFGGCIDRKEARKLRDFLSRCIRQWDGEKYNPKQIT